MSIDDKIELALQHLELTYKQLNIIQEDLISLIEQEEEQISRLEQGDLKKIAFTFNRLPDYRAKLNEVSELMDSIDKRAAKLKRRAIYVEEQAKKIQS